MHAFANKLIELNIYDQLQSALDTNPQENYDTFIKLLSSAKNKHLPKRIVRFNKKKHMKAKWLSRVKPLHKRGDKRQQKKFGKYRPVALMPSLSKCFISFSLIFQATIYYV